MTRRQRRRSIITVAILLAVTSILSALFLVGRLDQPQRLVTDALFFQSRESSPSISQHVVVVAVDDKTIVELKQYGRFFIWPRTLHADVVRRLAEARARTIAFDVLFDIPADGDDALADAIDDAESRATFVVLAAAGDPLTRRAATIDRWQAYDELFEPQPELKAVASAVGMANYDPDTDGTVRRVPLVFDVTGQPFPALPLISVSRFLRRPQPWDGPVASGRIPLAGREIPIDSRGTMIVNYAGGPYESTRNHAFPVVSFVDVLRDRVPPDIFRGKLVLVGITATAYADDYWTPSSVRGKMDGVEIHANAIDTILRSDFLYDAPAWTTLGLIVLFAAIGGVTLMALPMLVSAVVAGLALVTFVVVASVTFDRSGAVLNLVYPPLALLLTYVGVVFYRVIFEQGQSRALRGVLGQYLSPSVVAEVTRDPDQLKLGGDQREMTVMFSDLRGFTTFAESIDPETLVQALNEYLTIMSDVIFKHEGTIDKYMGDAIMAFWGAPQHQPHHATLACRAALDMVTALDELNARWEAEGRPHLTMGIGINTGVMKVGNMGSSSRFDYTVLGDAVNLASRLEGLNKEYGTTLIVSRATLDQTTGELQARFLDLVAVKGKKEPVEVFEIMEAERVPAIDVGPALRAYDAGIARYRERDWLGAAAKFQEALRLSPDDGPSAVYLQRCEDLMSDPPPADWDGVFIMTRK